jgi:7-cyano-7-deazaguanine synthase in queuosine biosynthesis
MKAIALLSGGLDSALAVKIMLNRYFKNYCVEKRTGKQINRNLKSAFARFLIKKNNRC